MRGGTIPASSAHARARRWLVTPAATCPRSPALPAVNSCTYAPKLARDRPPNRCPGSPPPVAPVSPRTAATPEPELLDGGAGAAFAARARPSENPPDRPGGADGLAVLAVASGTQHHTPAASPSPSPSARTAPGTPNTFDSCRTAGSRTACCSKETRHPGRDHQSAAQSAATATYVAALWIMKASTDGSLEGRR